MWMLTSVLDRRKLTKKQIIRIDKMRSSDKRMREAIPRWIFKA